MAETTNSTRPSLLPNTSGPVVRQRWLDLLELSYASRRVTLQEIEPGVHGVVIPAVCRKDGSRDLLDAEFRIASSHVPDMARGVRLALDRLREFDLTLPEDYRGWMGAWGQDIAAGATQATAFVDLAYLEAALLARLWDNGVLVEFGSPLALFRRGALVDYTNIYEAVVGMVAEGLSLADTADRLAPEILRHLQLYANVYHQLSSLYSQAVWKIDHDNFVIKAPGSRLSLTLQYWQLRGDPAWEQKVLQEWRSRIEQLLQQAASHIDNDYPKSFAA